MGNDGRGVGSAGGTAEDGGRKKGLQKLEVSVREPAAVDVEGVTGDEGSLVAEEKRDGVGDVCRLSETAEGDSGFDLLLADIAGGDVTEGHLSRDVGGTYGVDANAALGPFDREDFGQHGDAGLG